MDPARTVVGVPTYASRVLGPSVTLRLIGSVAGRLPRRVTVMSLMGEMTELSTPTTVEESVLQRRVSSACVLRAATAVLPAF